MTIYIFAIASVVAVSLVSLVGVLTLGLREDLLRKYVFVLVSLAVGALLGDAFIHLIPEAFEEFANPTIASLAIIGGIFIFFILEKILHWHHHGADCNHEAHVGKLVLLSDGVHNFIDGLIIGGSYLAGVEVGIATTIAVILHEIPQEIGDFGILLHAGYAKARALRLNFFSALLAVFGTVVALVLGGLTNIGNIGEKFEIWLLPITAGGFIYIAMSDLIPELQKLKSRRNTATQIVAALIGVAIMVVLLFLE